ncbi:serine-rich adhesin for platelets isoform X2 [Hylaeus volcanicus]|uniref:serine-rich adhesin for platelets isoform X2 n=1 Tax=Hylaeus volcanicus TaxID=313075 RepID=UPI0023B81047|nr:serine-rich adhesin for platelets isoform X2 [Hylaeus volcanicus]XP_053970625.1 serine-rich adhesin for platelets isoform X2 [Hylaeus volcanicus]
MATPQASSRLELLQARFQQKQLQEKEQKLLQLYDQQQQRAYQVMQRGSAGSNSSNHTTSVSQHTVTKTSNSSHTTSTSQGGKVRQMFDERRHTTVKGIDRSYPLEPLENKPRKQTNGNAAQKNGNSTVNRHSVTVKRVARADVNSNLNGGKPVVSYHEEVTRESFEPSVQGHTDDDEFGNENHVARYANGNHRDDTRIEEVLDDDTIQRNRMMAKLHLMQYDETLKHRVKNDLESEEFPEDFMVDVPDKLPKQSVTKKLSQAEARLERFRNANAKRSNSITKNTSTIGVPRKRFDPIFPAKSTSSGIKDAKSGTKSPRSSGTRNATSHSAEETLSSSESERTVKRKSDTRFFCKDSKRSATTYDSETSERLSPDFLKDRKPRSESPKYFCEESEKSATACVTDSKAEVSKGKHRRSEEPEFFCKESKTSATTYAINSKAFGKLPPKFSNDAERAVEPRKSKDWSIESKGRSTKSPIVGVDTVDREFISLSRSPSPGSQNVNLLGKIETRDGTKQVSNESLNVFERLTSHNTSPRYPYREPGSSTMRNNARGSKLMSKSPEFPEKLAKKRGDGSKVFRKHDHSNIRSSPSSRSPDSGKTISRKSSASPRFFSTDADRSATIMLVTPETITKVRTRSTSPRKEKSSRFSIDRFSLAPANKVAGPSRRTSKEDLDEGTRYNIRSSVSKFFSEQCEKASRNVDVDARFNGRFDRSSDLSRSSSPVSLKAMKTQRQTKPTDRGLPSRKIDTRKSSSRIKDSRSGTPEFFSYETDKPATTVSLKQKVTKDWTNKRSESPRLEKSGSRSVHSGNRSSKSPHSFTVLRDVKATGPRRGQTGSRGESRSSETADTFILPGNTKMTSVDRSSRSSRKTPAVVDARSRTPEFFCYETEKSATTVSLKPQSKTDSTKERSESPGSRPSSSTGAHSGDRSSKSPDSFTVLRDVKATGPQRGQTGSRGESRSSETADTFILPGNTKMTSVDRSSRSSRKTPAVVDARSRTPEFFCYETEKSATTVSLKPQSKTDSTKERSESPGSRPSSSTGAHSGDRSSKSPDSITLPKDVEVISGHSRSTSRDSSPRLQKVLYNRIGTPEFFCYETDKLATTVSLKSIPAIDSINQRTKSPRSRSGGSTGVHDGDRPSKSFGNVKDIKSTSGYNKSHSRDSSPKLQKIADIGRGTPEFYCYETEKSATTVSLKPKPTRNTRNEHSKRPGSGGCTGSRSERPSKSPDVFALSKDAKATARRGSGNVLRSTKLIREIIEHQKDRNQPDRTLQNSSKESRRPSIAPDDTTGISRVDIAGENEADTVRVNRNVDKRSPTPPTRTYGLLTPETSPKSSISVEVDAEIQEITMPDRYLERGKLRRELRSTYSRSSKETSQASIESKAENASTYSVRKPGKKRGSLFESDIFEPTKKRQQAPDHRRVTESKRSADFASEAIGSKARDGKTGNSERSCGGSPSPTSESLFRAAKRRIGAAVNEENRAKSLRSKNTEKSPRKQPLALGSVELVRKIIKGTRSVATNEVERKQEATKKLEGEIQMQDTDSVVSRTVEFMKYEEGSSRTSYERTDSVESALRRFDSIDAAASVQSTLEKNEETGERRNRSLKTPDIYAASKDVKISDSASRKSSRESSLILENKHKTLEFVCYETDKLATTVSLKPRDTIDSFNQRSESPRSRPGSSTGIRGAGMLPKDVELINNLNKRSSRESPSGLHKIQDSKSNSPEFVRYETDKLATTISNVNLKRKPTIGAIDQRSERPRSRPGSSTGVHDGGRSSKSPHILTLLDDRSFGIDNSASSSRTISLKALNRASSPRNPENKPSRTSAKGIFNSETPGKMRVLGTRETRRQKKLATAKDSFEIDRVLSRSKSPACRRQLFPDGDSTEETETGSSFSKTKSSKRDATYSIGPNIKSKCVKPVRGDETSMKEADSDRPVSIKQLRSIEDIRRSIENESPRCGETRTSRSAIASNVSKCSSNVQPRRRQSCPLNGDARVGSKKDTSSSKWSENLSARDDRLGESGRSVNCATRFSRVAKSPSPDSKATETNRTRRSVPPTPSKSPDTVTRRHSTDLKAQDTKSTKRPAPMKGTEPIGNRKTTTTTTTTTRKSTDVVDGAILENGSHLRDQTAETKYDNDSSTTKKNDAFVIAFDEQPPKENDVSLPRKPRLRKQSTEKHTPTSQSGRPPSVSSTSSGSTMQSHVSTPKSRMSSKVHAPSSATSTSRGSASNKTGGSVCSADLLTPCKICGRRFAQDRITLHEQICAKTGQKKRKQFDTVMFRVKGTELEKFVRKGHCKKQPEKPPEVKSNWRRKHEDFINAIRSAKQVQAHLAAGGKLSDLPPPPPSDTSDYIQCPHCGRKFNKSAADRHIPKCENMLHNKPVHSRAPKLKR